MVKVGLCDVMRDVRKDVLPNLGRRTVKFFALAFTRTGILLRSNSVAMVTVKQ